MLVRIVGSLPRSWIKVISHSQWRFPWLQKLFAAVASRFQQQEGEIQQGIGRGLRINPGKSNAGYLLGTAEPSVQAVLESLLRPGMTVYDVGANVGFLALIAARLVDKHGRVICFEPFAANATLLTHNVASNGFDHVLIRREALGAEDGESRFVVADVPTLGKLASVSGSMPDSHGEVLVTVRRLDGLIENDGLPKPDFIKIDVEGAEGDVLAGAAKTLRSARPLLLIELHGTNEVVARELAAYGYTAYVLGSPSSVREARWNAHVIGVPGEHLHLAETARMLTDPRFDEV
jgi:FkbM family methyltransferase